MLCIFLNGCVLAHGFAVLFQCREHTSPLQLCGMKAAFEFTKTKKHLHRCLSKLPLRLYIMILSTFQFNLRDSLAGA